eukprot:4147635-Pleurochrysis_carterae.AAC.6
MTRLSAQRNYGLEDTGPRARERKRRQGGGEAENRRGRDKRRDGRAGDESAAMCGGCKGDSALAVRRSETTLFLRAGQLPSTALSDETGCIRCWSFAACCPALAPPSGPAPRAPYSLWAHTLAFQGAHETQHVAVSNP